MKNLAGILSTTTVLASFVISVTTAYRYFFVDGKVAGKFVAQYPVDFKWLEFTPDLSIHLGILIDLCDDVVSRDFHFIDGSHLFLGLYERGGAICNLLFFPFIIYFLYAWIGGGNKHLPDLHFLGIGWCK